MQNNHHPEEKSEIKKALNTCESQASDKEAGRKTFGGGKIICAQGAIDDKSTMVHPAGDEGRGRKIDEGYNSKKCQLQFETISKNQLR